MASLQKWIQSHKQCICRQFPLSFSLSLIFEVSILEFCANIYCSLQLITCLRCFFRADHLEYHWPIHEVLSLRDDCIADFSYQHDQSGWSVVEFWILPNQQNSMHYWNKELIQHWEVPSCVAQSLEWILQEIKETSVVICLLSRLCHFPLQFWKWISVGWFVPLQKSQYFDHFRTL